MMLVVPGGRAAGQYELPGGWNGLLPLVANLWEQVVLWAGRRTDCAGRVWQHVGGLQYCPLAGTQ
jgi:hypothetical protein